MDLPSDFFCMLYESVVEIQLLLKANICVCLKLLFNEKSYISLIACVMFLQLKTAMGNDY